MQSQADLFPTYYNKPEVRLDLPGYSNHTNYARLNQTQHQCDNVITLPEVNKYILITMVFSYQNCSDLLSEKIVLSSDRKKRLKFEAEDQEFANFLRQPEQIIQISDYRRRPVQFLVTCLFSLFLEVSHI